jgi:alpha-galactosidase
MSASASRGGMQAGVRGDVRSRLCWSLCAIALALIPLLAPASAPPALALDNGLALTPYMGWNSYYGRTSVDEGTIINVANTIVARGLLAAGYQYVWLDVNWWDGARDARGNIVPPARLWPRGLRYLTDYLHGRGLRAGIYTDAGADGCGGPHEGSGPARPGGPDHYQQDANQFAAWGFDAVKIDFCGGHDAGLDPTAQFAQFSVALQHNASQRPLLINIDNPFSPANGNPPRQQSAGWSYTFGPGDGNSWRTETDVGYLKRPRAFMWADVLRNLMADATHPEVAGPGHWNDPDYLGPENGMTPVEDRAQFTMWAMVAAPLMIGSDVRTLSDAAVAMLTNPEVIAVDQDPIGWQGVEIADYGGLQVWMRYLATPGTRAVALLNTTGSDQSIAVNWQQLALAGPASVRDLWARADAGAFNSGVSVAVPSHGAALLLVSGTDAAQQ